MSDAKPTAGEWVANGVMPEDRAAAVWTKDEDTFICSGLSGFTDNQPSRDQMHANMHLIADAGTTYHRTGLTPSELAERCVSLEIYLAYFVDRFEHYEDRSGGQSPALRDRIIGARAILDKCKGQAASQ